MEINNDLRKEMIVMYKSYIEPARKSAKKMILQMSDEDVTNLAVQFIAFYIDSSYLEKLVDNDYCSEMHCIFNEFMRLNFAVALNGRYFEVEVDDKTDE